VRYLIVSDIHANLEALKAVLEHAAGDYEAALCCGDLIGYGADPNGVVEWARESCAAVVRGNHDKACTGLDDLEWFNPVARTAAEWTQRALTPANAEYARSLQRGPVALNGFHLVHGSPFDEDEYVISAGEAAEAFGYMESRLTFFGHTHVQGGFLWNQTRVENLGRMPTRADRQRLDIDPECAYLVNPGSVGQPRDGDARAAYAVYDTSDGHLVYRRVAYDVAEAQRKIHAAGLPPILADRLSVGR
jgi:diadenosine tetraphosphatase ApaH/serine/threonine PP2A family protein phosphatase